MNDQSNIRPLSETLKNASQALQDDENVLRAGLSNVLALRAAQLGRKFLTPIDIRKLDICLAVVLQEPAAGETTDAEQFAPQAQSPVVAAQVLKAVEDALTSPPAEPDAEPAQQAA